MHHTTGGNSLVKIQESDQSSWAGTGKFFAYYIKQSILYSIGIFKKKSNSLASRKIPTL